MSANAGPLWRSLFLPPGRVFATPACAQFLNRAVWLGLDEEGIRRDFAQGRESRLGLHPAAPPLEGEGQGHKEHPRKEEQKTALDPKRES